MTVFDQSWNACWRALDARGNGHTLMMQLLAAYGEPHRHYHTTQHLQECLALMGGHHHEVEAWAEVEIALWFHDAIYNVRAHDNEARSAEWAAAALRQAGVTEARIAKVHALIMATCHDALPTDAEAELMVDIDLAILGAEPTRFQEYEAQIRAEYAWVPGFIYKRKRRALLRSLLEREPLFRTASLRQAREAQARENLRAYGRSRRGQQSR